GAGFSMRSRVRDPFCSPGSAASVWWAWQKAEPGWTGFLQRVPERVVAVHCLSSLMVCFLLCLFRHGTLPVAGSPAGPQLAPPLNRRAQSFLVKGGSF